MSARWNLDDIAWHHLAPERVDAGLLAAVKTAAMVEANSADYVTYLHNVFADDACFTEAVSEWGDEEAQHGAALGRWAETVDPSFDFSACLQRFREGYRIPVDASRSVRGSATGELLARCIVESGTCSFYAAMRDYAGEPVLRQICHRIAQDEAHHYRLFKTHYARYAGRAGIHFLKRLKIALGRVGETSDDELAYAYYSANLGGRGAEPPYDRGHCARAHQARVAAMYRIEHVRTLVHMIASAVGINPGRWPVRVIGRLGWWCIRGRAAGFTRERQALAAD
jgi:rubrerythrin